MPKTMLWCIMKKTTPTTSTPPLPNTGIWDEDGNIYLIIGLALILGGLGFTVYNKRSQFENRFKK